MRIVADDLITYVREGLARPWVKALDLARADAIDRARLMNADALLVRSKTRIDAALLEGTPVRFVGSATVGVDHVDAAALERLGVAFVAAPRSSAASVAQFTLALLVLAADRACMPWRGKTLAVVGCGAIGSRVAAAGAKLGLRILRSDPPLAEATGDPSFVGPEALGDADFVTFHVPLVRAGLHPTAGMVDAPYLARLKKGVILINTSRGAIVEERDLARALLSGVVATAALDVFQHEPVIPDELLTRIAYATPHVAGRSLEGMAMNTKVVVDRLAAFVGDAYVFDPRPLYPKAPSFSAAAPNDLAGFLRAHWDLDRRDAMLKASCGRTESEKKTLFAAARECEPMRRDLTSYGGLDLLPPLVREFLAVLPAD